MNETTIIHKIHDSILKVSEVLDADRTTLFLVDKNKNSLVSMISQDLKSIDISLEFGTGIVGKCAQMGEVITVNKIDFCTFFNKSIDEKSGYRTKNAICCPILSYRDGKVIGVIETLNKNNGGYFLQDDEEEMKAISPYIASLLDNLNIS